MNKSHYHWQGEGVHVHYIYQHKQPVACLALMEKNKCLQIGLSLRSPSEKHYDKRMMRKLAIRRCRHVESYTWAKHRPRIPGKVFRKRFCNGSNVTSRAVYHFVNVLLISRDWVYLTAALNPEDVQRRLQDDPAYLRLLKLQSGDASE